MATRGFRQQHKFEKRKQEADKIRSKYDDRIPVIVERAKSTNIAEIDKKKYLVPADLTVGQFTYVIRKRIKLGPEQALWVFVETTDANGKTQQAQPLNSKPMSVMYDEYKDPDGFLYIIYSGENVFGAESCCTA
eukprot:m.54305 g.54305  ORF g.54305 m.54305 type:complete len:134 (-) comp13239_c0_seq2:634-1035(-)